MFNSVVLGAKKKKLKWCFMSVIHQDDFLSCPSKTLMN